MSLRVRISFLVAIVLATCAESAAAASGAIPTYARQTGFACSACHTQFPELNAMGRLFKLNAYTLRAAQSLEGTSPAGQQNLLLNLVAPISAMLQTSYTFTSKAEPGKQNGSALFPDELSLFLGGEITPKVGGFLQITFDPQSGTIGMDNADFRFATHATLFSKPTTVGLSLNNNPTVQDLWNSTPVWSFPYASSAVAPTPAASPLIDGALGQQVAGLTAYAMWSDRVYAEIGAYRTAPLGIARPLDSTATDVIKYGAPYWRLVLPKTWGGNYFSVGTYGMYAKLYPAGVAGPTNRFTDIGVDATLQLTLGHNDLSAHGEWVHEKQNWDAGGAANPSNTLNMFHLHAIFHIAHDYAIALAPFLTSGSSDATLYAPAPVTGSRTGSPNSNGVTAELDVNPWQNLRLQFQYVLYNKFNGASSDYDGSGRKASDNNTLYVVTWLMF